MNLRAAPPETAAPARAPRLLFVVNNAAFFVSHRLPIAIAAREEGYDVAIATPAGEGVAKIEATGFRCHIVPITRGKATPFADLAATFSLVRLFRRMRPDIVHAITLKPVVYAGIAARIALVPAFVAAISGLGYAFIERDEGASRLRGIVERLCRVALRQPNLRVIFQNDADRDAMVAIGAARHAHARIIRGSGVNLDEFRPRPEFAGTPLVLLPSRMLRDKGIAEFVCAARRIKAAGHQVRFVLSGAVDPGNPASCTEEELNAAVAAGLEPDPEGCCAS